MVDLGVRLQQLRMDRNMSQSELGKALNRSNKTTKINTYFYPEGGHQSGSFPH